MRNFQEMVKVCPPVRGQRLSSWLERFLVAHPDQLAQWSGTWTEVNTAKVVEIIRKRGCVEEHEANRLRFGQLVNACYRAPVYEGESNTSKPEEGNGNKQTITTPDGQELVVEVIRRNP